MVLLCVNEVVHVWTKHSNDEEIPAHTWNAEIRNNLRISPVVLFFLLLSLWPDLPVVKMSFFLYLKNTFAYTEQTHPRFAQDYRNSNIQKLKSEGSGHRGYAKMKHLSKQCLWEIGDLWCPPPHNPHSLAFWGFLQPPSPGILISMMILMRSPTESRCCQKDGDSFTTPPKVQNVPGVDLLSGVPFSIPSIDFPACTKHMHCITFTSW